MIVYANVRLHMNQSTVQQYISGTRLMNRDLDLLTLDEAATLLKVSIVTLRRWIKQGRLPAYHVGPRKVRIKRSDLTNAFTPTYQEEVSAMPERSTVRPLTDAQVREGLAALKEADAVIEVIRERRGGQPLDSSVPLIHRARETRAKHLL
jgi:excisionase family DNA binding protein